MFEKADWKYGFHVGDLVILYPSFTSDDGKLTLVCIKCIPRKPARSTIRNIPNHCFHTLTAKRRSKLQAFPVPQARPPRHHQAAPGVFSARRPSSRPAPSTPLQ